MKLLRACMIGLICGIICKLMAVPIWACLLGAFVIQLAVEVSYPIGPVEEV